MPTPGDEDVRRDIAEHSGQDLDLPFSRSPISKLSCPQVQRIANTRGDVPITRLPYDQTTTGWANAIVLVATLRHHDA